VEYDFSQMEMHLTLVTPDFRGLTPEDLDPVKLASAERWIKRRAFIITFVLVVVWPLLTIPAGIFSEGYFFFWVLLSLSWGVFAGVVITMLPLLESWDDIERVVYGLVGLVVSLEEEIEQKPTASESQAFVKADVSTSHSQTGVTKLHDSHTDDWQGGGRLASKIEEGSEEEAEPGTHGELSLSNNSSLSKVQL